MLLNRAGKALETALDEAKSTAFKSTPCSGLTQQRRRHMWMGSD